MSTKGKLAWGWIVLLVLLRHDFWLWDDPGLVLGFMPVGLLSQMGVSMGAALGWWLVVRHAWPTRIEEWAQESEGGEAPR